jgi:hypothetical protein
MVGATGSTGATGATGASGGGNVTVKTASYTLQTTDKVVIIANGGSMLTLNLPAPVANFSATIIYDVQNTLNIAVGSATVYYNAYQSGSNNYLWTATTGTINTMNMSTTGSSLQVASNGTNWYVQ